jgi:DNA-binding NarL/FixJ family response regulator
MTTSLARAGGNVLALQRVREAELTMVLADEHPVVRSGLRALLESIGEIEVVAEARTGREAVREALLHRPDVLMMDLELTDPDGITAIREVQRSQPGIAVLVFTMCDDDASVFTAMRAGARGFIHKDAEQEDIVRAIRGVAAGEAIFGPSIAARLTDLFSGQAFDRHPFPDLTSREREVLDLIAEGLPNSAIARRLYLAPKTISNHISTIFSKLGVPDRAAAIVQAREAGLGRVTA